MVVDVIITTGAGVGAGGSSKASEAGTGTGTGRGMVPRLAPQQQPWTSGGISRSCTTRDGTRNRSTNAPCQTDGAFSFRAHALIAAVASALVFPASASRRRRTNGTGTGGTGGGTKPLAAVDRDA